MNPLRGIDLGTLRNRTSLKWRTYTADVLPMWVAEMDCQLAPPIADALRRAADSGDTGYAMGGDYAEAMVDFAQRRWGWTIDIERTMVMPDVMLGVVELLKVLTQPGDPVIVSPPVYPPFYMFTASMGLRAIEAPLTATYRLDFDALDRAFAQAKVYLLCSPHNPTGTVHTPDELAAVADLAGKHGVTVIVDEIHAPLTMAGATFTPYLTVPGTERAFAMLSASKAWNLAALKAAVTVAGEVAAEDLKRIPEEVSHGVSHFGVISHVAALREGGPWLDDLLSDLDYNRRLLKDVLAEELPMVGYQMPQATYLTWLDCRRLDLGDDPAEPFLERGRLAVVPGPRFGTGGAGFVRMNIGTAPDVITDGVRRMRSAV